jgi:hypothetical protein
VVGDSFAHTLASYAGRNSPTDGVTLIDGGLDGCDLARGAVLGNPGSALGVAQAGAGPCAPTGPGWPAAYAKDVVEDRPNLSLLVLGPWDLSTRFVNGQWASPGQPAYAAYYRAQVTTAVNILTAEGGRVAITTVPYVHTSGPQRCVPLPATIKNCPTESERVNALNSIAYQVAKDNPQRVTVIRLGQKLSPQGRYTRTIDGVTVRAADGIHLSEPGGEWISPWIFAHIVVADH